MTFRAFPQLLKQEIVALDMVSRSSETPQTRLDRLLSYQQTLMGFSRILGEAMPVDRLLHHATAQVARVTHIRHVKIMQYRPDKADLLIVAGVGWKPGVVGTVSMPIDQSSPPGRALQTAAPVIIEDCTQQSEFRLSPLLRDHGIVSLLNVPIRIDGKIWGIFEVDVETTRTFDEADVGFLATFSNMLGMALRRRATEDKLLEAVAQNAQAASRAEMLLRELQHRIKNNFQVIIAFLTLQRRHAKPTHDQQDRFSRVIDRVHAIALAHDQLTFQDGIGQVEFGDYLRALCSNIDPHIDGVVIEVEARGANLPIDRAVPAGLIVNELVTNSLKYAFDQTGGVIRVSFATDADIGEACLTVEDNGRGMGEPREGGLGTTLIRAFATQLDGRVESVDVTKGTCTRLCFPLAS